ncbi:MAG: hypothetical protein RJA78_53 [Actinomycetota bacterium]
MQVGWGMTKTSRLLELKSAWKQAFTSPWDYPTYPTVATLVLLTTVALARTQPSLSVAWSPLTTAQVAGCVILISLSLTIWLNLSKALIAKQNSQLLKFLTYFAFNAFWTVPQYIILTTFLIDPLDTFPLAAGRLFIGLSFCQMFWGLISNQLNKELVAKEGLVRELVKQRTLIIESEEETRQLVSKYLHNNLQSGLVVINHQLSEAIKDLPEDSKARFQSILQELELMRKVEIRDASKALSPNLDVLDLEMLIAPLVDVYRSSMVVRVKSSDIEYSSVKPIALAVYRIVEQVLLNATVHGRAKSTTVEFVKTNKGSIQLTITNDGQPINLDSQSRGTGTAIVDTWVSSLEGSWNMSLTDSGATSFRCNLTLPSS